MYAVLILKRIIVDEIHEFASVFGSVSGLARGLCEADEPVSVERANADPEPGGRLGRGVCGLLFGRGRKSVRAKQSTAYLDEGAGGT
jgi:poly(3-hydroxybutyrate) depolymerase